MPLHFDVVIVGAGQAGAQAAISLRQLKFGGTIAMVGEEPELPYQRPPLSKEYLLGKVAFERMLIRPAQFWGERQVTMLLGQRVKKVDPDSRNVTTDEDVTIGYGRLIWAAGAAPRRLSCIGHDVSGVHVVRSRRDVDQLIAELPNSRHVVIVGGGYIGLETAAALVNAKKQVTVIEVLDRVLARVAGEPLARFYETEHRNRGVHFRWTTRVVGIEGQEGRATGVHLSDGELLHCDLVIVGIGVVASVEPLLAAGAIGSNGVKVDAQCRTSLPDILAVGDCAIHANRYANGDEIRLESVQNANDQATVAAKVVAGISAEYDVVPWFWSNQYDLQLKTVGLSAGYDQLLVRGDPTSRSFTLIYLRAGKVVALDCVNATTDYAQGRALILGGMQPDIARLTAPEVPLKEIASPS